MKRMHECEPGSPEWWAAFDADGVEFDRKVRATVRLMNAVGAVSVSCLLLALIALALSGCGMSALERHTTAAGILHASTGIAAQVVDQGAREAADRADDEAELAAALVPWRRAEAAQHVVAAAVDIYVAEVLAMAIEAESGEPDDTRAVRALVAAVSAYGALVELLGAYGVTLPPVGRVLALVGAVMGPVEHAANRTREWVVDGVGAL